MPRVIDKKTTSIAASAALSRPGLVHAAQPLYAQLRDRLKADILEGRLKPGDKVASESELTAGHGVSRITVRQALNDLQKEGLVVKAHGKGTFVAQPAVAQDLTSLRGLAESLGGEGRTVHGRLLSTRTVKAPDLAAQRLQLAPRTPVCELQTLRYLNRTPLSLNTQWVALEIGERLRKIDFASRDLLGVYENELGLAISHADLSISAALAADAKLCRQLGVEPGAALLQVDRVVYGQGRQPLHFEISSYRSDLFSYQLSTSRERV